MLRVFVIAILLCLVFLVYLGFNPLRKSERNLQAYVLDITPIGTHYDEAQEIIRAKDWKITMSSEKSGFLHRGSKPRVEVGSMYVRASLGDYRGFPFEVNVTVYWGFSESGELIDIWVWKTSNGL